MRSTRLLACAVALATFAFVPAAQAGHDHRGHHGKKKPRTTVRGIVAASDGAAEHRRHGRRHAPHRDTGLHRVRRLRARAHEEGGPEGQGRRLQHARVGRDRAAGVPAAHADGEDLPAGHRGRRRQRGCRLHHVRVLADRRGQRTGRAGQRPRDPEPGDQHEQRRLRGGGLPGRDPWRDLADPARHVPVRAEDRERADRRRGRRDPVQRGRQRRRARTRASAAARRISRSRPCSPASRSDEELARPPRTRPCG